MGEVLCQGALVAWQWPSLWVPLAVCTALPATAGSEGRCLWGPAVRASADGRTVCSRSRPALGGAPVTASER